MRFLEAIRERPIFSIGESCQLPTHAIQQKLYFCIIVAQNDGLCKVLTTAQAQFAQHTGNREKKVEYKREYNRRLKKQADGEAVVFEMVNMKQFCNKAPPMLSY